jgi:hypothetical protein
LPSLFYPSPSSPILSLCSHIPLPISFSISSPLPLFLLCLFLSPIFLSLFPSHNSPSFDSAPLTRLPLSLCPSHTSSFLVNHVTHLLSTISLFSHFSLISTRIFLLISLPRFPSSYSSNLPSVHTLLLPLSFPHLIFLYVFFLGGVKTQRDFPYYGKIRKRKCYSQKKN